MFARIIVVVALPLVIVNSLVAQTPDPRLQQAAQMMGQSNFDLAAKVLNKVVAETPKNYRAWSMLGACQHSQGQFAKAIASYEKVSGPGPLLANALFNKACSQAKLGQPDAAIDSVQQAFAAGFNNVDLLENDPDLKPLHQNKKFQQLLESKRNSEKIFAEKDARIIHRWLGEAAGDEFGWVARVVGDCDGDDVLDFVATSPSHRQGTGKIYVYSGKSGKLLFDVTGQTGERLGNGASSAGDVDGDKTPDVLIGAPNAKNGGAAYIFSGKKGKQIHRLAIKNSTTAQFGYKVSTLFDIDDDGYDDVFVGAIAADGKQKTTGGGYAFSGKTGKQLFALSGERTGDKFGSAAAATRHGTTTWLAVGAQDAGQNQGGVVYVYKIIEGQPKLAFKIAGDANNVNLGQMFVSFPGDLNGDGTPDVYASDWQANVPGIRAAGKIVVHSGADGKELLAITGKQPREGFGTSPSDAGDVNGDGVGDLIVGAWQNRAGAPSGGRVTLHNGSDGKQLDSWTCVQAGDTFGFDAVGIGDVDGDGHVDFLLTSAWANIHGPRTGRVFIVAGKNYQSK